MCGIAGFIGAKAPADSQISATLHLMKRRGPDHQDSTIIDDGGLKIVLLHARLAIIDLDTRSNQPFSRGSSTLVFNGEIYNYIELREKLAAQGEEFNTTSDTEVLITSYLKHGPECVTALEGMWSYALYDRVRHQLVLSRDRFGEKPLYFMRTSEGIYFGSEIKFIRSLSGRKLTVNRSQIQRYLVNGYRSLYKAPRTFYQEVEEVPQASNLIINSKLETSSKTYWKVNYAPRAMSLSEAVAGVYDRLMDSVKLRLRADVPLAFCLSGGVDSGAIASIAAKKFNCHVSCYSIIDPDERYNEYDNMKATVDDIGCEWTPIEITKETSLDRLADLVAYHDAPVATISYYIHSFLSAAIAADKRRVVFSGTAADELFTGYYDHYLAHLYETRENPKFDSLLSDWKKHVAPVVRNPYLQDPQLFFKDPSFREYIFLDRDKFSSFLCDGFSEEFEEVHYSDSLLRNRMLNELFHESIPVILKEDDLNSMRYSLENRSPYLDSKLCEFAFTVPSEHLISGGYAKHLLREATKGILNEKVRLDRQKKGFNASINSVFQIGASQMKDLLLAPSPIFDYVKREKLEDLISHTSYTNSFSKYLFSFLSAKLFLEQQS